MSEDPRCYRPSIESPYPDGFKRVQKLRYLNRLALSREPSALLMPDDREASCVVAQDYTVEIDILMATGPETRRITVPAGMLTDPASVPRFARGFVGRVGPHLEAAIVHDFLFIAWQLLRDRGARREDFRFANEVMHAGLSAARVPVADQLAMELAMKAFGVAWGVYKSPNAPLFAVLDPPLCPPCDGLAGGSAPAV